MDLCEFEANLIYIVSSRSARTWETGRQIFVLEDSQGYIREVLPQINIDIMMSFSLNICYLRMEKGNCY